MQVVLCAALAVSSNRPHVAHRRRAQSAEPSPHDSTIAKCTGYSTGRLSISQTSSTGALAQYSGFASTPTMLWLTNEAGTVVSFKNTSIGASSTTLVWSAFTADQQPLDLQVHSCPPAANLTDRVRSWAGQYEDSLAICCSEKDASTRNVTDFGPSITMNWNAQSFRVRASKRAPRLNYAKDSTGMVLRVDAGAPGSTAAWDVTNIPFTPLATKIEACALLREETMNPICVVESLVERIATDLERRGSNPTPVADLAALGVSRVKYEGAANDAVANFAVDSSSTAGSWCAMYARNVTGSGNPVAAFANGSSLMVPLNRVTDSIQLYKCCEVSTPGNGRPNCANNALFWTPVDIATLRTAARTEIATTFADVSAGMMSLSVTAGSSCAGVYRAGQSVVNATGGQNCTCVVPGQFQSPIWQCAALPTNFLGWEPGQVRLVASFTVCALLIAIASCVVAKMRKPSPNKAKRDTTVQMQVPAGADPI